MDLRTVIFDLKGVVINTANYPCRGWPRVADGEGLPFNHTVNACRVSTLAVITPFDLSPPRWLFV